MAVRRVNGRWLVEFMQSGHRVFKRLPEEATRQDATAYETKLRREIFDQATLGKRPEVSLEYAIKAWLNEVNEGRKSERATNGHAQAILGLCNGFSCQQVVGAGQKVREGLRASRKLDDGAIPSRLHPATVNRRLCILKAVAKFAWQKGWTQENLSARIQLLPENNARQFYLTQEQVNALIEATPERSRAFVGLAVYTGIRQGQIIALKPSSIVGEAILLPDSKGGMPLMVPIIPAAKPYLSGIPFKLHKRTHYADFEKARDSLGIGHFTYHDLRHTTASLMIQAGADLYTVGEILGHRCVQTTKRYAHLAEGNKRKALQSAFPTSVLQHPYSVNEDK
jgi:integrase